jgi:hypothetical protein
MLAHYPGRSPDLAVIYIALHTKQYIVLPNNNNSKEQHEPTENRHSQTSGFTECNT